MSARVRLVALAIVMTLLCCAIFLFADSMSDEEKRAFDRVRAIQAQVWGGLKSRTDLSLDTDPHKTGLIGIEWSAITTTLGPLEAKRTATNPLWAAWLLRYFDSLGLKTGDAVVINASGSFPGLLLAALVASESRGLDVSLFASMTSSTWGANRTDAPLPVMLKIFQDSGLKIAPRLTIGGNDERGGGLDDDAISILRASAGENGFELLDFVPLAEIEKKNPKLIVLIGGSVSSAKIEKEMKNTNILRLLNLKKLSQEAGISYGNAPFEQKFSHPLPDKKTAAIAAAGIIIFFVFMKTHKRWEWETSVGFAATSL